MGILWSTLAKVVPEGPPGLFLDSPFFPTPVPPSSPSSLLPRQPILRADDDDEDDDDEPKSLNLPIKFTPTTMPDLRLMRFKETRGKKLGGTTTTTTTTAITLGLRGWGRGRDSHHVQPLLLRFFSSTFSFPQLSPHTL